MTRFGFVALIGMPNAGKSTLLNTLVGGKVSIVTPKVQTTRTRVLGITVHDETQLVFVDTPGLFAPKRRLERAMVSAARQGVADADRVVLLVDAQRGVEPALGEILATLPAGMILALNKIDLIRRDRLLALAQELDATGKFTDVFMISAETGDGVGDLMAHLAGLMPEGPWHYPEDQMADVPLRLMAAEITREKLFLALHDELPYALTVETESWEAFRDGSVKISQTIYVERDSQKKIVLGREGRVIKRVSQQARTEIAALIDQPVHLFTFVKVREKWTDDPERYAVWGLDPGA